MQARASERAGDWPLYLRLLNYVKSYWYFFVLSMLGYLAYSLGTVMLADLLQFLFDAVTGSDRVASGLISGFTYKHFGTGDRTALELARVAVPIAVLLMTFARGVGYFAGSYFISQVARNLVHALRCNLFDTLLLAPSQYYESRNRGELISRLTFNVEQVAGAATKALNTLLRETLIVCGLLGYMLYLNWRLCLVFIMVAPVIALVVRFVGRHFRRYSKRIQSSMGDVTEVASESVAGYAEIKLYGAQTRQQQRFARASTDNLRQSLKLAFANALSTPIIQMLLALSLAFLIWLALSPSMLTGFTGGSLVAFLTAASQLGKPIRQLSSVQNVLQRGLAAAEDIFQQMDQGSEPDTGNTQVVKARGDLQFENVGFSYPSAQTPALSDVSLRIEVGQRVAIVGRSGSGKSTLVKLLSRFYAPTQGEIRLDGIPLAQYQLANLRQQIAVVAQDAPLFNDTVYYNIAFGSLVSCDEQDVLQAAHIAHASEFIEQLPQGMQTLLGEGGVNLSGGQRQRIALARAILKDAPILILDEATSALDNESAGFIARAMDQVMLSRTGIVIAHRLATVEQADQIIVLDAGRVVAQGRHQELLLAGGVYAQLYAQEFTA